MTDYIYSAIIYILFAAVLFLGAGKGRIRNQREALTKLNKLRGIFALDVVIGHAVQYQFDTVLHPFSTFMLISVGFFFFISAFGMTTSVMTKKNYIHDGFLIRKCGYLFAVAIIVYLLSCAIGFFTKTPVWHFDSYASFVRGFVGRTNWYVWQLMAYYVLFYIVYRFVPKYRCLVVTVIMIIQITVSYLLGAQERYYVSSMCFPLGMVFGEYYDRVSVLLLGQKGDKSLYLKYRGYIITAFLLVLGMGYIFLSGNIIGACYLKNVMCIGVVCALFIALNHVKIGNKITKFLTTHSLEIYMCQFVLTDSAVNWGWDYKIKLPFILFGVLFISVAIHPALKWIKEAF